MPVARTTPSMLSPAGPLSGTLSGVVPLPVIADDQGAGLARAVVLLDGKEVASATFGDNAGRCVMVPGAGRTYNWIEPCAKSGTTTVQFDTSKVADGEYQAQLVAEDASGNRGVAAAGPVVLRNATAIGPGSPLAVRGAANGTPSDDAPKLTLAWKRGSTVRPSPTIELPWSTGEDTIVGRLLTAGGQPIGGARVRIAAVARRRTPLRHRSTT